MRISCPTKSAVIALVLVRMAAPGFAEPGGPAGPLANGTKGPEE
jgi:hypothetical protein